MSVELLGSGGVTLVTQGETTATWAYAIEGLAPYAYYHVRFSDPAHGYATEYFFDSRDFTSAPWIAAIADTVTGGANAALEPASAISGRVTRGDGSPIQGVDVTLWRSPSPSSFVRVADYETDDDGRYVIVGLGSATYRLEFYDPQSGLRSGWHGSDLFNGADLVVGAGDQLTNIDAVLAPDPQDRPRRRTSPTSRHRPSPVCRGSGWR